MAMRCAERTGMCTILWRHEFYKVKERVAAWGILVPSGRVSGAKVEEGDVGAWCGVCACAACEEI
jgi:hypothetical protein